MGYFESYLQNLDNYELLILKTYRFNELDDEKKKMLLNLVSERHINEEQLSYLKEDELKKNSDFVTCPRCKTNRVIIEQDYADNPTSFAYASRLTPFLGY